MIEEDIKMFKVTSEFGRDDEMEVGFGVLGVFLMMEDVRFSENKIIQPSWVIKMGVLKKKKRTFQFSHFEYKMVGK